MTQVGIELFTEDVLTTLNQFEEADQLGSSDLFQQQMKRLKTLNFLRRKDTPTCSS